MKNWAVEDYGLYILPEDVTEYADSVGLEPEEALRDQLYIAEYNEADGEVGSFITGETFYVNSNIFFIGQLQKMPSLFQRSYKDVDEALAELKANFGKYLNEDFDYEQRFVSYSGTMFG